MFKKIRKQEALKKASTLLANYLSDKSDEKGKESFVFSYKIKVKIAMLNEGFSEAEIAYVLDFIFNRD